VVDTTTGRFRPREALGEMLDGAGVAAGRTVVTYCHIGQQASLVWLAARLAGRTARLYDGSFQDWAARSELPVVTGK
jgi:thiosulfate/3-mercaptopyruvate sulfurtransferase